MSSDSVPQHVKDAIRLQKQRYIRHIDTKNYEQLAMLCLPSATFTFYARDGAVVKVPVPTPGGGTVLTAWDFSSSDAFVNFIRSAFSTKQTIHMVDGLGDFESAGEDEVRVVWNLMFHAGPGDSETTGHMTGGAHYHETWRRVNGEWLIASLKCFNLYRNFSS